MSDEPNSTGETSNPTGSAAAEEGDASAQALNISQTR